MADEHAKLGLHKGRPKKMSDDATFPEPIKLHELGLFRDESSRLKALAETPAPILDAIMQGSSSMNFVA